MHTPTANYCSFTNSTKKNKQKKRQPEQAQQAPQAQPTADDFRMPSARDYPAKPVDWLWPGRIPIGKVTLLIGDPGLGKSLVALDVASRVSTGAEWPEQCSRHTPCAVTEPSITDENPNLNPEPRTMNPPGSVLILSSEDDVPDTIRPRLEAHGADLDRVFFLPALADLRHDFHLLQTAIERTPDCRLIIVDPVNAYVGASDSHFHTIVRKVLTPLAQLAAQKRIAILAVTHLRKHEGAAIYRASGSMGFVAAARAVWTLSRDKNDPRRNLLLPVKNNLAAAACGLAYTIEPHPERDAPLIRWQTTPVSVSAEQTLAPDAKTRGPEAIERDQAVDWLTKRLADGPQPAAKILAEGIRLGFSERTLRRALDALGGQTEKEDFRSGWVWMPPPPPPLPVDQPQPDTPTQPSTSPQSSFDPPAAPEKPGRFAETWPLRPNTDDFGDRRRPVDVAHQPPNPPSTAPDSPKPPSLAESIAFIDRRRERRTDHERKNDADQPPESLSKADELTLSRLLIETLGPQIRPNAPPPSQSPSKPT